jgi:hypothetical protein
MNRLPGQHLDSQPDWKRRDVYQQIGTVSAFRSQGLREAEVAQKATFDAVDDMYFRLKRWGL